VKIPLRLFKRTNSFFRQVKNLPEGKFRRFPHHLAGDFGQGADSAGRNTQFHVAHVLDLQVDLEFAAAGDVGMTASIA